MKVHNMTSNKGNKIANQFIITDAMPKLDKPDGTYTTTEGDLFQSYESVIAFKSHDGDVWLDNYYWDYSVTTSKYRNQFLGESKKETQAKIDSGEYILINLN